ncbi:MAG: GNAT family N-acetyltransferase [Saprospiraceae bacterium]|nr:GNAT family N-acetyltransferase [Saprospiraceae bacterium]MCF8248833.1 GNAT family N-acetyltransferase [Saprospiraceae bacterium]MCF8279876.1 GNAT family N-acetyltransferase [Bacteroidales bacterium]MCF8310118.1 GNAT family N-acetyltransferase [Saprospiraceae bacterium]MCF8439018.1 GNAT family N-acetyltransferase [Saprospiraceae bacterium]
MPEYFDNNILIEEALRKKNVQIEADARDLKNMVVKVPSLFIVNQALEDVDELVLIHLLNRSGIPFKLIERQNTNDTALTPHVIHLNYYLVQWQEYVRAILKELYKAKSGGYSLCLILHFTDNTLDTPVRDQFLTRLMRSVMHAEIPVVPVRLKTSFPGFIRPSIGGRIVQWMRGEPHKITVRVGSQIPVEEQQKFEKPKDFKRFIQSKIFALGSGLEVKSFFFRNFFKLPEQEEPIAKPIDNQMIINEIGHLKFKSLIASQGEYDIFVVEATEIPHTIKEIGRLRELTFREVGEGTGKALDLDEYDLYYHQLILWDREAQQIAGGYRMGIGDEIFERYGAEGFYISSLFKIKEGFHPYMKKSVELGRSYIVPQYQRKRLPLFLLWKGILYFLLKNPQFSYLYGPVSISKYYSNLSRGVIVAYIKKFFFNHELALFLKPRKPFKVKVDKVDIEMLAENLGDQLQALDNLIEDIEPEHFRLPVLVRQYLKLNARFISFNVDPNFSDVLDGFIILDLNDVPIAMIESLRKEVG